MKPTSLYRIDDGVAYWRNDAIAGVDIASFVMLDDTWARDARKVFSRGRVVRGADVATFERLNALYARDARAVYFPGGARRRALFTRAPSWKTGVAWPIATIHARIEEGLVMTIAEMAPARRPVRSTMLRGTEQGERRRGTEASRC